MTRIEVEIEKRTKEKVSVTLPLFFRKDLAMNALDTTSGDADEYVRIEERKDRKSNHLLEVTTIRLRNQCHGFTDDGTSIEYAIEREYIHKNSIPFIPGVKGDTFYYSVSTEKEFNDMYEECLKQFRELFVGG